MSLLYMSRPSPVYEIYLVACWTPFTEQKEGKPYVGTLSVHEFLPATETYVVLYEIRCRDSLRKLVQHILFS
jgi:uncharacterized protein YqjF (DUF2071 family)